MQLLAELVPQPPAADPGAGNPEGDVAKLHV
jgi:hypothetical protein